MGNYGYTCVEAYILKYIVDAILLAYYNSSYSKSEMAD